MSLGQGCQALSSRLEPQRWARIVLAVSGLMVLLVGAGSYLAFRQNLPAPLAWLQLPVHPLRLGHAGALVAGSLPSFLHVLAFGLLTCAFLELTLPSALSAGAAWAAVNTLWEFSCVGHQPWLWLIYERVGAGTPPSCTYDPGDIVAAWAGGLMVPMIASLMVKGFHQVNARGERYR